MFTSRISRSVRRIPSTNPHDWLPLDLQLVHLDVECRGQGLAGLQRCHPVGFDPLNGSKVGRRRWPVPPGTTTSACEASSRRFPKLVHCVPCALAGHLAVRRSRSLNRRRLGCPAIRRVHERELLVAPATMYPRTVRSASTTGALDDPCATSASTTTWCGTEPTGSTSISRSPRS